MKMKRKLIAFFVLCLLVVPMLVSVSATEESEKADLSGYSLDGSGETVKEGLVQVNGIWGYYKKGILQTSYTGLAKHTNGTWYYVRKGTVDWNHTGLVKYNGSWYYVQNGKLDKSYTGVCKNGSITYYVQKGTLKWGVNGLVKCSNGDWYYVKDSRVQNTFTGLVKYNGTWYYVNGGKLDKTYTGVCKNGSVTYYVQKGTLKWGVNGLVKCSNGDWYYVKDSRVQNTFTGLVKYNGTWYYVNGGKLDKTYTGVCKNGSVTYYVQKGTLKWGVNGLVKCSNGDWFYVKDSRVQCDFTGIVQHTSGGWYYVNNGKIDWTFTGTVLHTNGKIYCVYNGKVSFGVDGHLATTTEEVAPTCTVSGKIKTICTVCDKVLKTVDNTSKPALGHDWYEKSNTATCTTNGTRTYNCNRCTGTKSEKSNATGHVSTHLDTKNATCIEDGWEKTICDACGSQVGNSKTLPAHGNHSYETANVAKAAKEYSNYWGYGDYDRYLSYNDINCDRCKYCYDIDVDSFRYKYSANEVTYSMLSYVNNLRRENGLPELQASSSLISNASRRAQEISINFMHTQGSENICSSGTLSNCIGNAYSSFYNSSAHRATMLRESYTSFGCAIYYYNGRVYCVQVFD